MNTYHNKDEFDEMTITIFMIIILFVNIKIQEKIYFTSNFPKIEIYHLHWQEYFRHIKNINLQNIDYEYSNTLSNNLYWHFYFHNTNKILHRYEILTFLEFHHQVCLKHYSMTFYTYSTYGAPNNVMLQKEFCLPNSKPKLESLSKALANKKWMSY